VSVFHLFQSFYFALCLFEIFKGENQEFMAEKNKKINN